VEIKTPTEGRGKREIGKKRGKDYEKRGEGEMNAAVNHNVTSIGTLWGKNHVFFRRVYQKWKGAKIRSGSNDGGRNSTP